MLIRAAAEGTDTYELNRNLVLTDGARADSVPNLEIETGEIVGAGHACATGRFDDEQLFYLQARGIPEDQARRLVVRGFFADILAADRRRRRSQERLMGAIDDELHAAHGCRGDLATGRTAVEHVVSEVGPRPDRRPREHGARVLAGRPREAGRVQAPRSTASRVAVVRDEDGDLHAINDVCSHQYVLLSEGEVDGLHDRVLAARLALRPAHRRSRPGCPPPARSTSTR